MPAGAGNDVPLLIALLLASATPEADPPISSGQIQDICSTADVASGLACAAYLRGVIEGLAFGQLDATDGATSFCLPDAGITPADARAIFLGFVAKEPDRRGEVAGMVLLDALDDAFPCGEDDLPGDPEVPVPTRASSG